MKEGLIKQIVLSSYPPSECSHFQVADRFIALGAEACKSPRLCVFFSKFAHGETSREIALRLEQVKVRTRASPSVQPVQLEVKFSRRLVVP